LCTYFVNNVACFVTLCVPPLQSLVWPPSVLHNWRSPPIPCAPLALWHSSAHLDSNTIHRRPTAFW
jgi:hypothetical protein